MNQQTSQPALSRTIQTADPAGANYVRPEVLAELEELRRTQRPGRAHADRSESSAAPAVAVDEAGLRAEYDRTPSLRAEFRSADVYVAYARAAASGRARILSR